MERCQQWTAIHDHMPPGPEKLTVRGVCTFPRAGFTAKLQALRQQGSNPRDLLMKLLIQEPEAGPDVITEVEVLFRKDTKTEYKTVTITSIETVSAGLPSIKVEHPR